MLTNIEDFTDESSLDNDSFWGTSHVKVYVGADDNAVMVSVSEVDDFVKLKKMTLENYMLNIIGIEHWIIVMGYKSSVRTTRSLYIPSQTAPVLKAIRGAEIFFPGELILALSPLTEAASMFSYKVDELGRSTRARRRTKPPKSSSNQPRGSKPSLLKHKSMEHFDLLNDESEQTSRQTGYDVSMQSNSTSRASSAAQPNLPLSAEVLGENLPVYTFKAHVENGLSVSKALLWEIFSASSMHGQLILKRYMNGEKMGEITICALVDAQRLWFFPMRVTRQHHPDLVYLSYVDLPHDIVVRTKSPESRSFTIENLGPNFEKDPEKSVMVLRAESAEEKADWVDAVRKAAEVSEDSDDDDKIEDEHWENHVFRDAEEEIVANQLAVSQRDFARLNHNVTFEGMLQNRFLRERFQSYLKANFLHESFMFWEQVEDFRSGSINAGTKYKPSYSTKDTYSAEQTLQWAESIYDTFICNESKLQISECSGEEAKRLREQLDAARSKGGDSLDSDIFIPLQNQVYRKLKYNPGHYTSFVMLDAYRQMLKASLHASERHEAGLHLLATTLSDNRVLPSELGIVTPDLEKEKLQCLFQQKEVQVRKTMISRLFGPRESEASPVDDENVRAIDEKMLALRELPWRTLNADKFLPAWWWAFLSPEVFSHVEDIIPEQPTTAGLCIYGNELPLQLILETVNSMGRGRNYKRSDEENDDEQSLDDLGAIQNASLTEEDPKFLGHKTQLRLRLVERPILHFSALKIRRSGLYGSVKLTGVCKCHHIVRTDTRETYYSRASSVTSVINGERVNNARYLDFETQYCVLSEFDNKGRLLFFDETSNNLMSRLRLELITEVSISKTILHGIELHEGTGAEQTCAMVFVPVGVESSEHCRVVRRWIDHMLPYCAPDCAVSRYLYYGELRKRGVTNSSFQSRFFTLTSEPSLRYYRLAPGAQHEETPGSSFKGEIDFSGVKVEDVVREYMKPNTHAGTPNFSIKTASGRTYHLCADDLRSAEFWYERIVHAIQQAAPVTVKK